MADQSTVLLSVASILQDEHYHQQVGFFVPISEDLRHQNVPQNLFNNDRHYHRFRDCFHHSHHIPMQADLQGVEERNARQMC